MGGRVQSPAFVGRVQELRLLEAAWARALKGDPAVVLVEGEAGVGKTRLVAELAARATASGGRVLSGGCLPVGEGDLPFAPIVESLRPLPDELGTDVVQALAGPSWVELGRLLPGLGESPAGPPGPAAQTRLFELLLGLLARLAVQAPIGLVVEDLHWADRSTLALLAFLARNLRRERVLLVVTYRTDEADADGLRSYLAELARNARVSRLELARLDRAGTAAQLTGILGDAPSAELLEGVFARSEGNPFFTEELLESVRLGSGSVPPTLHDLLKGRMAALDERTQRVLRVAAVAGRQVLHALLAAVAGLDDRQLDHALREAVTHRLLVSRPDSDSYQFRHALIQETVYADLLPGERSRLHAGYANALIAHPEQAAGSPAMAAAELAVHWDAAGDPIRALSARVDAGLAAEGARAFAEAVGHYRRALELWERVPASNRPAGLDRIELLAWAGEAVAFTGGIEHAIAYLGEAVDQVDQIAESHRAARLLVRLGEYRREVGDEAAALTSFTKAEHLLAGEPPSPTQARAFAAHGLALLLGRRTKEAEARCQDALTIARAVGARPEEAWALRVLASCLSHLGELDRAITMALEARRVAEEAGDAETLMTTYVALVAILGYAGRDRDAIEDGWRGYRLARDLGLERAEGSHLADNLAFSLLSAGRWEECERLTRELTVGDSWGAFGLHQSLGVLLARRGEFEAAREQLDLALELGPPYFEGLTWLGPAELAIWEGDDEAAAAAIAEGQRWFADRDPEGSLPHRAILWYPLVLRLEADRAERAAARRAADEVGAARQRAAPILQALNRLVDTQAPQAQYPIVTGHLLLAQAEESRLQGRSDPERWRAAGATWERLARPFEAAYATFRQAEALLAERTPRSQVEHTLRPAHDTAVALGAEPLRREIERLAQRGRLRLTDPATATPGSRAAPAPAEGLGLTRREAEVLSLVAAGRTNRQIGQELFITPRTAGVHVSRILAKLGVAGRGEAAAIAHRLGLDKP
jgi:DNA-binding CsgD family transcriptional regulator/tetratricopeptide (TPR) repeat protein